MACIVRERGSVPLHNRPVELTATIGAYNMVPRCIEALSIELKDELSTGETSSHVQP